MPARRRGHIGCMNLCRQAPIRHRRPFGVFSLLTVGLVALLNFNALSSSAETSVTLAWNPVLGSGATGYALYYGTASRSYSARLDAGTATQATISGLTVGATYYFAVTTYTSTGTESDYSTETMFTPSNSPPVVTLTSPVAGGTFTSPATINFAATVIPNGHTINKVRFYSATAPTMLLGESLAPPYSFTWPNVSSGTYTVVAEAVYDGGPIHYSQTAQIFVGPPQTTLALTLAPSNAVVTAPFAFSGGMISQAIQTTTVSTGGRAAFWFTNRMAGNYVISAQVVAPNSSANSFYVNVDADPTDPLMLWNVPVNPALTNQSVTWQGISGTVPKSFLLSAGPHQLIICGHEAGAQLGAVTIAPAPFNLRALSNKQVVVSGVAQPNSSYQILATQDFKKWTLVGTVTSDATGSFSFTDTAAPSFQYRFYQLKG